MAQQINGALNLAALVLSAMLFVATLLGGNLREAVTRWFFVLVTLNLMSLLAEVAVVAYMGTPGRHAHLVIRIVDGLNCLLTAPLIIAVGMYFYTYLSTKGPVPKVFLYVHGVLAVGVMVVVIVSQFVPIIGWLDAENQYHKGELIWVYELFLAMSMLSTVVMTLRMARQLRLREGVSLLLYAGIPILCYVLESVLRDVWPTYFGSAVALFLIYINIQLELRHKLREKDAELAENRIAIMVSQIQPHFIFNTLSAITSLCEDNPQAQEGMTTFSRYLRTNMDALSQKAPIPFGRELAHVQQYLWLEQLRFEERLSVCYDILESDFMLPVLTLQPIVENAVRHGLAPRASGGSVWIRTERDMQCIRMVVRDDGVGFDPAVRRADGRSHTGMDNVRARLAAMCKGTLVVRSAPGEGTTVIMEIPVDTGSQ